MKPLSIQEIRKAVNGKAASPIPATAPLVSAVCTDTRRMESGCLFVAINGENFNAHNFLPDAAKGGAVAALIQEQPQQKLPNLHLIEVPDTRAALGKLATHVRLQMRSKVIAVAGSNGKTSTKYLIDSVLSPKLRGSMSPKSFNNDIGVPLTILPADPTQDYLVLEIGTNHPGEIKVLTDMARPDVAVITNCGAEHLEFLDDLMGVRRENASIITGMTPKGMLVVNGDDPELLAAISPFAGKRITFGFEQTNDLFATDIQFDTNGTRFLLNGRREVFVPMLGRHAACNSLAAIAVGRAMRLNEQDIITALAEAHGPDMRLQIQEAGRGVTLLNDAYNANPNSMRAALETLSNLRPRGRRLAVLGDMRELGKSSDRYHREIGELVAKCGLDALTCVGQQAALIAESAEAKGMAASSIHRYADSAAAARETPRRLRDGDMILLKASRSIHLELVAQAILEVRHGSALRKAAS
ncbi:MAG TPA: UDP-N-acetylmuramoyl-tripeptide--D-alanyl-D-alanine ligase [Tepidisphaeraceae bacterium]|nr:UDP-N-acetylmuramoyl-tripeptide--D-alanyl-D-alanine ligase [Tepidisphaeraceae bacterium]